MPQWIHDRAMHLRRKNPDMPKSEAYALSTQQSYAAGKAPKKWHGEPFGTPTGKRVAKDKYDDPKSTYEQTANPKTKTATSVSIELLKAVGEAMRGVPKTGVPTPEQAVIGLRMLASDAGSGKQKLIEFAKKLMEQKAAQSIVKAAGGFASPVPSPRPSAPGAQASSLPSSPKPMLPSKPGSGVKISSPKRLSTAGTAPQVKVNSVPDIGSSMKAISPAPVTT